MESDSQHNLWYFFKKTFDTSSLNGFNLQIILTFQGNMPQGFDFTFE